MAQNCSTVASSSSSNSLNDAQKDSGELGQNVLPLSSRTRSFNQSTSTFSGETNPPSATYAMSTFPTSAHTAFDEDYCDSKEPLIIDSSSLAFLRYPNGPASNRFWGIPRGAGLRGGAGETSLNNGAGSWGHPPASGGWGGSNATNQGQWGATSATSNRGSAASQGPPGAPPPGTSGPPISSQQQLATAQPPQGAWDPSKNVQGNPGQSAGATSTQGIWAAQVRVSVLIYLVGVVFVTLVLFDRLQKMYLISRPIPIPFKMAALRILPTFHREGTEQELLVVQVQQLPVRANPILWPTIAT